MLVVVFPSPAGVGLIAVTSISLASGLLAEDSRALKAIFALKFPYLSIWFSVRPIFSAVVLIGKTVARRAISRSLKYDIDLIIRKIFANVQPKFLPLKQLISNIG
jgi:hypothetical protein